MERFTSGFLKTLRRMNLRPFIISPGGEELDVSGPYLKAASSLQDAQVDGVFCVAGGWAGGSASSKDFVKNADLMIKQSVWSSAIAAKLATTHLKPGGLLQLTGAAAATGPTPSMIGYGSGPEVGIISAAPTTSTPELANGTEANDSNILPDLFYGKFKFEFNEKCNSICTFIFFHYSDWIQENLMFGFERTEDTKKFNALLSVGNQNVKYDNVEIGKPFGPSGGQKTARFWSAEYAGAMGYPEYNMLTAKVEEMGFPTKDAIIALSECEWKVEEAAVQLIDQAITNYVKNNVK